MTLIFNVFFYNEKGDVMKIYIDALLFLNFAFDFLLLLTTSIILKRNIKIINIIIGSFIGSLSILILFFNINNIELFLIKIYLSIIMCLATFHYKDLKYLLINLGTFYIVSILLGGFLYMLNIEFSYKHQGLIFYHNQLSINVIMLFIISPIILYIYLKQTKYFQKKLRHHYKVDFTIGKKTYNFNGYLDTGNNLTYKDKPVILTNKKIVTKKKKIFVPYVVIDGVGILECIKVKINVHNLGTFDVLMGYSENINISGVDVLLNNKMEATNDK